MIKLIIKFNISGFHYWKNAPNKYFYLRNLHRHLFHWEIVVKVTDADREIEFIDFNDKVQRLLKGEFNSLSGNIIVKEGIKDLIILDSEALYFGSRSCEMIAQETYNLIKQKYNDIIIHSIAVIEDNENGAIKEWA